MVGLPFVLVTRQRCAREPELCGRGSTLVTYRNNNLRSFREKATQLLQLGGVSILLLFQVP
jgi:hypothetical protein